MDDSILTIVFFVLLVVSIVIASFYAKRILDWWNQKQTNNKRDRAHAGRVKCEEDRERCTQIATHLTHNGYYCPEHWEQNSKYMVNGGYVTWHHVLYHSVRGS